MRRMLAGLGSAALVAVAGIGLASPASATTTNLTDANCGAGVVNGAGFAATTGDVVTVSATLSGCTTVEVQDSLVNSASDIAVTGSGVAAATHTGVKYQITATSITGVQVTLTNTSTVGPRVISVGSSSINTQRTQWIITFTGSGGGGGGGGSSAVDTPTPVHETLSLGVQASGASCTGGNPTGYAGTWLVLPSANQCAQSGAHVKPGVKLLGWATSADFPIAIAQHQLDMRWGVDDGDVNGMRMIFIPGGGAVYISGSNSLYPVWSE